MLSKQQIKNSDLITLEKELKRAKKADFAQNKTKVRNAYLTALATEINKRKGD